MTDKPFKEPDLLRGLGLWSSTAVVIGGTIGTGIFLVTSQMARDVGSVPGVIGAWVAGGVLALFGIFGYAELGAALPKAGGDYAYLSRGFGPLWGFLYGWKGAMVTNPASIATIAAGLMRFVGFFVPSLAAPMIAWQFSSRFQSRPYLFTVTKAQLWAVAAIAVVAAINYFGVRTAGRIQVVLTSLKVGVLAAIVVFGVALGRGSATDALPTSATPALGGIGGFLTALVSVMWAFSGFCNLGLVGSEVVDPQKTIPRAAILGVLTVSVLYVLVNLVYFRVLGISQVAQSQHVASDVAVSLVGDRGARWLTISMMISAIGALHVNFLELPRVPYAMARDGYFFQFARRVQPVFRTPSGAILFVGCMGTLLVLTGTFEELFSLAIFAASAFQVLTTIALIRLRVKEPDLPRPYRAWFYPWSSLIFATVALAMTVNLWRVRPVRCSIGLAIILLGIPFFYYWRKRLGVSSGVLARSSEA